MDGDPKRRRHDGPSQRPQIYVHLEFGVSWTPRHAVNTHQVTFRSKNVRDRSSVFPRQVPAPNTNYLAAPVPHQQGPSQAQIRQRDAAREYEQRLRQRPRTQNALHDVHDVPAVTHRDLGHRPSPIPEESERRSSRDSRSSHERGHSAPPPISDNAWDITSLDGSFLPSSFDPAPATASDPRHASILFKDLPPTPHNFRLGEDDMPWSWSWPLEYGQEQDATSPARRRDPSIHQPQRQGSVATSYRASVTSRDSPLLRTRSAGPASPVFNVEMPMYREFDPERHQELETLSAAMVTIDNGFENQWWNQGAKESTVHPALFRSSSARTASEVQHAAHHRGPSVESLGWAVARQPQMEASPQRDRAWGSISQVVSPVSPVDTPGPMFSRLERSMSTRSEELFLAGGRYA